MTRREKAALLRELGPPACSGAAGSAAGSGLKDGGSRLMYGTGAVRESAAEQGRYDLLPMEALRRLAVHCERGAAKYADENWRKGLPTRRCLESALRHLCKFMHGYRDEDHLAAVMWNVAAVIETQEMIRRGLLGRELDALPDWTGGAGPAGGGDGGGGGDSPL